MVDYGLMFYISVILLFLLLVSLYFNLKFFRIISLHKENDNALIRNAYFNPITDLPNRANIELVVDEQIERALRHKQIFLISVIKIKNFYDIQIRSKKLSDEFMQEAADRLLSSIRNEDIIGHITDDGFIVVFNEYLDEANYNIIVERIKSVFLKKPHINTKYNIEYKIGIGYAKYPNDGSNAKTLIDCATRNALK